MSAAQDPLFFGPDPVPRRSAEFPVPPGACDAHAHVVGPHDTYRLSGARPGIRPPEALLSDYMAMLDALGIERAVLVQPSASGTDNPLLLDCLAANPERPRGIATIGRASFKERRWQCCYASVVDIILKKKKQT